MKRQHNGHGEYNLFKQDRLPDGAKRITLTKEQLVKGGFIVAPSETTGNHHCIKVEGAEVEFYEKDGVLYMVNKTPTELFCVDEKRHDTIEIPAGIWKGKPSQEFDHLRQMKRNVAD